MIIFKAVHVVLAKDLSENTHLWFAVVVSVNMLTILDFIRYGIDHYSIIKSFY